MQAQPTPPAPSTPPVLASPAPAQIPSALAVLTSPAAPTHAAQAAPPTAPATTSTVLDPVHDVIADAPADDNSPTPTPINTEAETKLTAEINKLWGDHKSGKASARRTRAEMKALRLELGSKLHAMKAILVGTGRGGNWARYLRSQRIPIATADRHVAEFDATLAPTEGKLLTEELPEATVDQVREAAKKLLPRLTRLLVTQEMVYEFVHEILWGLDVAEVTDTDLGLEIPRTSQEDSDEVDAPFDELAEPAPATK